MLFRSLENKLGLKFLLANPDPVMSTMIAEAGHSIVYSLSEADVVVDCRGEKSGTKLRRMAVDSTKPLIGNERQLDLLLKGLGRSFEVQPYSHYKKLRTPKMVELFVRQGFTESSEETKLKIQKGLDAIVGLNLPMVHLNLVT